jgi:hypothetical protein
VIIDRTPRLLAAAATVAGALAWMICFRADLVLSHYDAKAHLVVARRVIDNITPGWQQIGAVWLPLPHLIQIFPTQIDTFYRTGAFGSLVSVLCFGVTAYAAARLIITVTGSRAGAATAVALLAINPNLLYLQATPMTEPLLFAVTFAVVLWLYEWVQADADAVPTRLGVALFAAAWTRYEAWLVLAAALTAAIYAGLRSRPAASAEAASKWHLRPRTMIRRAWNLGVWPAAAVAIFLVNSRITVGSWFVSSGFYVPDPTYEGLVGKSLISVWWGTHQMSGYVVEIVALVTAALFIVRALWRARDAALLVPVALFATAALPFYAFVQGHPFRIRYMVPLVAGCALFSGLAVGLLRVRWAQALLAAILIASLAVESPLWDGRAPLIEEAQWDVPASLNRRGVTQCLRPYQGEKVLASMGSLAHYMQELSHAGFDIADFLNEGNGALWEMAMKTGPAPHAGWMLVEEEAEGGDVLAQRIRRDPAFATGMTRICEGGGVALYKRSTVFGRRSPVVADDAGPPALKTSD